MEIQTCMSTFHVVVCSNFAVVLTQALYEPGGIMHPRIVHIVKPLSDELSGSTGLNLGNLIAKK